MFSLFKKPFSKTRPTPARRESQTSLLRPRIEPLESRRMMAGDVSVLFADGSLDIIGDGADNAIYIYENTTGIVVEGANGTTVNGVAGPLVAVPPLSKITNDLNIDLNGGDDSLVLFGFSVGDDITVFTDGGHDSVAMTQMQADGEILVVTGGGSDSVAVIATTAGDEDDLTVDTGRATMMCCCGTWR